MVTSLFLPRAVLGVLVVIVVTIGVLVVLVVITVGYYTSSLTPSLALVLSQHQE
jgi:hypothetical protein